MMNFPQLDRTELRGKVTGSRDAQRKRRQKDARHETQSLFHCSSPVAGRLQASQLSIYIDCCYR